MLNFIGDHLGTVFQLVITLWMASIARSFQVTMSVYGLRLETHREAMRRGRVLWWLKHEDNPDWNSIMTEMRDWLAVNEVYLEPAAAEAFITIHTWKELEAAGLPPSMRKSYFDAATAASEILRRELLRFRKRTLRELLRDRRLLKKPAEPKKSAPTP